MTTFKEQIISILDTVEGGASFYSFGNVAQLYPGLHIEGYGEIPFPFTEFIYKDLIKWANQAPFGKGSETITDTSIRRTQEIDANKISFKNPKWEKTLQKIVASVKKDLAIENKTVSASLYKLLIYKEGDFFLTHKDSEKEKGMFGSLIIALPARHTGGELIINFDEQTKSICFSEAIDQYQMPYVAFYTDCEHEIKKVTTGYRLCLVYNLIQLDNKIPIKSPLFSKQVNDLTKVLKNIPSQNLYKPLVIFLNHQYTPANFSFSFLKRNDAPQAETIFQAADKAGYYAKLGLMTCYQMGELLADFNYDYYSYRNREREVENGEMGEIYEEDLEIRHWAEDGIPGLGHLYVEPEDFITNNLLKEGDPIEKEEEGFTGNAGMTMEYWYHYGAVIIWSKKRHTETIKTKRVDVKLQWLSYYLNNWNTTTINYAERILKEFSFTDFNPNHYKYEGLDYSPITKTLFNLDSITFVSEPNNKLLLTKVFRFITIKNWMIFIKKYPFLLEYILTSAGESRDVKNCLYLALFLKELSEKNPKLFKEKGLVHVNRLPEYLNFDEVYKSENSTEVKDLLESVLFLSKNNPDQVWISTLLKSFTNPKFTNRYYVNKVLINTLLSKVETKNNFAITLADFCLGDLKKRTAIKPTPPKDWTRKVPNSNHYKRQWAILKDFIESPTENIFDYAIRQSERSEMENAIKNVVIDLKCETIRKGSPHTLRIIKTRKAYEKKLKDWKQDMLLLRQLKDKFIKFI